MANAYADVATWHGLTPYVGAGIGASYNIISNFRDNNIIQGGGGQAGTAGMWNLAWGLHGGVGFNVSPNVVVDFGYSFLNLGDAKSGLLRNLDPNVGCDTDCEPVHFKKLVSHDFKLAVRYEWDKS